MAEDEQQRLIARLRFSCAGTSNCWSKRRKCSRLIILTNGAAYEHTGLNSSNWYYIWSNVRTISVGRDSSSNPAAFVLFNDGTLWEHHGQSSSTGWQYIWNGISSISASQLGTDDVFVVLNNGSAYEHIGFSTSYWYYVYSNVKSISAARDDSGYPAAFVLFNDGSVWEHQGRSTSTGWQYIWNGVTSLSASELQGNTVFIRLNDGSAYENNDGSWSYVWSGVVA